MQQVCLEKLTKGFMQPYIDDELMRKEWNG